MLGKIFIFSLIIFSVFTFTGISMAIGVGWHIETIDSDGDVGLFTSIGMDSADNVHISYFDISNLDLKYTRKDSGHWVIETVDNSEGVGTCTSLAIDSKDYPQISYYDYMNGDLKYTYKSITGWHIEVADSSGDVGLASSIDTDASDNPNISYYDASNGELKYAYKKNNIWYLEIVDSSSDVGMYNSLKINPSGYPCIAYFDFDNWDLKYAYKDGSGWHIEIVDSKDDVGTDVSLALDKLGNPHISYYDYTNGDLKYATKKGGMWTIITVDSESDVGIYSSIIVDNSGYSHISYYDYINELLKYAYEDKNSWHTDIVDNAGQVGTDTSITLDSKGYLYISYSDNTNKDLKYAWNGNPNNGINLISFTAKPNNSFIVLRWDVSTDEQICGFNLYRREALQGTIHELLLQKTPISEISETHQNSDMDYVWTKVNSTLITGINPYLYTDSCVEPEKQYEYKLEAVVSERADTLGTTSVTSGNSRPESFDIVSIYPSPACSVISIDVNIPITADVDISVYDITGRHISDVGKGQYSPGVYTITSDVSGLTNGVYIVRMMTNGLILSKNFVVVK